MRGTNQSAALCASRTNARLKGKSCYQLPASECEWHWTGVKRQGGIGFACQMGAGKCRRGAQCSEEGG